MMTLRTREKKKEVGSVLLETVIAIPLFMLLIGGTIWIGQLSYDKQKLVIADRYVAWNAGNRANTSFRSSDISRSVHDTFFTGLRTEEVTIEAPGGTKDRWGNVFGAGVDLTVSMPVWTYGFILAGQMRTGGGASIETRLSGMHGRDNSASFAPSGKYWGHVVLMRSGRDGLRSPVNAVSPDKNLPPGYANVGDANREPWPADKDKERK